MNELLTPFEMGAADRFTIDSKKMTGIELMRNAGERIVAGILELFPEIENVAILCGPGNNGGDGYCVASLLAEMEYRTKCFRRIGPRENSDAFQAATDYFGPICSLESLVPQEFDLLVDGLYGAGLDRLIMEPEKTLIEEINQSQVPVIAIDLPSGVSGADGQVLGAALRAAQTITFFRKKPGHVLQPGRSYCGQTMVVDIGISDACLTHIRPQCHENSKSLWQDKFPAPDIQSHKYSRGHVAVFSGNVPMTGASRLSALAAARCGAGAVTLLAPADALPIHAVHLTSIMLHELKSLQEVEAFFVRKKVGAAVLGPGFGDPANVRKLLPLLLNKAIMGPDYHGVVLDADGLMAFEGKAHLLEELGANKEINLILTPHEGEFRRLFGSQIHLDKTPKIQSARLAAEQCQAVVIYKGSDTVIAAPDGRVAINTNGSPYLSTAGSGDVLSGLVAGLIVQNMPGFEAACAAVWLHAAAAHYFGPGLIAEDISNCLPAVLKQQIFP